MPPNDPFQPDTPPAPDLPDAALPSIEPVPESQTPTEQPQPVLTQPTTPPVQPPQPTPVGLPGGQAPPNNGPKEADQGRSQLSHVGKKYFNFIEFDDQEELLVEIRKHPFGLFIIVLVGILISLAIFVGITAAISIGFLNELGFGEFNAVVVFAGFLLSIFVLIATMINAHLYRNNVVFVTSEKIAQVLFITLFNKKISQLSIGDVQDVTVQQNGFLPNLFGYGTLVVETAGEQQNYTFTFVPKPYENSKVIINAHESNLKQYGN